MNKSDVRERVGRSSQTAGPVFDLVASKLRRPVVRPETVHRLPLIERGGVTIFHPTRSPVVRARQWRLPLFLDSRAPP
jgi:hypothetical protein